MSTSADLVLGEAEQLSVRDLAAVPAFLAGGGECGALMRGLDWSASPLGGPATWPQSLRSVVGLLLNSKFPMFVAWGEELGFLYNDPYIEVLGAKHPRAMGRRFRDIWSEIWPDISPLIDAAMAGEATYREDLPLLMNRHGFDERTWFTFSYSPVRDESGAIAGMFCACTETTEQVTAEGRLRESEARHRQVLDSATDYAIVATDLEGRVTRWNEGARRILGWSEEEMLGQTAERFFTPEDRAIDRIGTEMRCALETGVGNDERWHIRKSGERFWAAGEMTPLHDEAGETVGFVKVLRDRTEQRLAESRLRESEDNYRHAVELSPQTVWTARPDGQLDHVAPRWREWTGTSGLGSSWGDAIHPDDLAPSVEAWTRSVATGEPYDIEHRVRLRDGSYRWMHSRAYPRRDEAGAVARWYGTTEDIHAARVAEEALRESEARFRNMADHAPVMMWVTDPSGYCTYLNRRWYEFTGQSVEESLGLGWTKATHPDDEKLAEEAFLSANAARAPFRVEYRLRRSDGAYRWAIDAASPRFGEDGAFLGYVGSVIDIDERREAEQALRTSEARLRALMDQASAGLAQTALDGRFVFVNDRYCAIVGRSREELLALRMQDLTMTEDLNRNLPLFRELVSGGPSFEIEKRYLRPDGSPIWVRNSVSGVREADGSVGSVLAVSLDISEQKQAEARQAFMLDLSDLLRTLDEPDAIMAAATEALGRHLGVSRVGYGAIDTAAETVTIERDWNAPGIRSLAGVLRFRDYGSYIEDLKRGETVVFADAEKDPRTAATAEALKAISAQSVVNMPLTEHGSSVALLYLNHATAREWTEEELALVREIAERTRTAVERRRAEQALRQSEVEARKVAAEQAATLGQLAEGVIVTDAGGRITLINDAAERLHGAKRLDIAPDDYSASYSLLTEDGHPYPSLDLPLARAVRGDTVQEARWRIRRPDGSQVLAVGNARPVLDGAGRQVGAVLTIRDDTARRAAEEELERLNRFLEETVAERTSERDEIWRVSQDMLLIIGRDGVIRAVNPAWTKSLGYGHDELVGARFDSFVPPEDVAPSYEALERASEGVLPRFENRYRHKDGTWRNLAWTAAPSGNLVYCVARDVTQDKQREAELARAQEELRQSQKMEAVGQLTGGIAHDFNNLLTGITGSLELLNTRIRQGRLAEIDRYTAAAQGAAKRAAALTHRLLAFSRRQTLDPKPTDMNRLVAGMEELIRRTVGPEIAVETVAAGGLWTTLVDPHQLENALLNLCINARDAMPDGGRLTIETGNKWLDARAARDRDLPPGQYVTLCASDTGTGMTPEVARRAFDPFFTTKPIGMGTGLGLSMIYGFVRQSGGQARIYSEAGQGTMVCLYLPRHLGEAEDADAQAGPADAPRAAQGETVLVVDDEPTVRMLVAEILEDLGYTAIEAADGAAGLKVLRSDARIDLLVTDVGLPGGMNGRQVADAARAVRPGLKVLFITGYAENAVLSHGHLDPGMHVLTKPFPMEVLASRIKDLIAGA